MKIGLIGLPKTGKTTIFNALTKLNAQVSSYADGKVEPNIATAPVGDPRVDALSALYKPKKTVRATVEIADFAGAAAGGDSAKGNAFPAQLMRLLRTMDALAVVVRNFVSDAGDKANPAEELSQIEEEIIFADLIIADKRLENIEAGYKKGQKTAAVQAEEKVLRRIHEQLGASRPVRELALNAEESKLIRGFQFLTQKPVLVVINSDEAGFGKNVALNTELSKRYRTVEFSGTFEMELSRLASEAEAALFMQEMGITESARDRLVRAAYDVLGYISFFTVGDDEVRAWTIRNGETALDAAGAIHTDLARGFIRAETFSYDDLIAAGSEKEVKRLGKLRLEGKEYRVKDGDILNIRFGV